MSSGHLLNELGSEVVNELESIFKSRTRDAWVADLADIDCCCVPVRRPEELLDDPLFLERDLFFSIEHPACGSFHQTATPLTPADRHNFLPPPLLGEHSDQILLEAGWSQDELEALHDAGVITTVSASGT